MKKIALITLTAVAGLAIGCTPAANTTTTTNVKVNGATTTGANANTAVVVNSSAVNTNGTGVTTVGNTTAMTREDYDKNKDKYVAEAKAAGSTIGSGLNDGYLHTKAKLALATVAGLRDSTINVDVNNEVVTLRGSVATKEQSEAAVAAAKVDGVKSVTNNLKISAGDSLTNQMTGGSTDGDKKAANSNK